MEATIIQNSIKLWEVEPAKAQIKPTVKAKSDGSQAIFEAGSFSWSSDLPPSLGGKNAFPSPTAYLLSALAGCAVVFIRDILAPQFGVQVESVSAVAQCEADFRGVVGFDNAIPDLVNLSVLVTIQSSDPESQVQKIFDVWKERCPILLALTKPQSVQTTLEIKS
jgi:uncharacterized OsmC-like protein